MRSSTIDSRLTWRFAPCLADIPQAELERGLWLVKNEASLIRGQGAGSFNQAVNFSELADSASLEQFGAIFIPGGYAPMLNLWNDASPGKILRLFHEKEQLTVTLCRGGHHLHRLPTMASGFTKAMR